MGMNTVAVLLNDYTHEIERSGGEFGKRLVHAMLHHTREPLPGYFGSGRVISCSHADYYQIVIVHANSGTTIYDANDLPYAPLDAMADCLRRHGWTAKPSAKKPARKE